MTNKGKERSEASHADQKHNLELLNLWCFRAGAQKLLGVLITIGEAVAYVVSGMYGDIRTLGATNAILIIIQVLAAAAWHHQCKIESDF